MPTPGIPRRRWLAAFEEIANGIGPRACYQIGRNIPKYAVFPPSIKDIHSSIASVDVAYHLNHRKQGKVMFDPGTGKKLKGIGNYGYQPVAGQRKIVSVCENPYPCDFDRGILTETRPEIRTEHRVLRTTIRHPVGSRAPTAART